MKKLAKLLVIMIVTLFFSSCFNCKECTVIDENGNQVGIVKLCGNELKEAEKDPNYICE